MRTVISVVSVLACALSSDAQITTTLNRLPNGMDEVRIRNNSTISLVAFVVTVNQAPRSAAASNAPFVVYSDPLIEPATKPLLASEEREAMVRGFGPGGPLSRVLRRESVDRAHTAAADVDPSRIHVLEEPIVAAGIFADGATTGDAAPLARLVLRRSNMLLAVETTLETLLDAGTRNVPRDQLIEQFKKMADSVRRWYLPPEQQVGRSLYQRSSEN
jgi:hypothetical protein